MFELVQMTAIRSDCTAGFNVRLGKPYTVGELVDEILSTRTNEWGYIGIFKPGISYIFGDPNCQYRYGKLITNPLPDDILSRTIKEVRADGGWSRMDYIIKLEE